MVESKPHIIFIMSDQHRGDAIGAANNSIIKTPTLDNLAKDGVYFPKAYSSTPSCTPARAGKLLVTKKGELYGKNYPRNPSLSEKIQTKIIQLFHNSKK